MSVWTHILGPRAANSTRERILASFSRHERVAESGPYITYREVLRLVMLGAASDLGFELTREDEWALSDSVPTWPAFAETPGALRRLKRRFRLAVLSNVDDLMFNQPGGTREKLGVELDEFVSAEQVGSYKPAFGHFHEGIRRLGLTPSKILHVAESRYHDVGPAGSLGMRTVWLNRKGVGVAATASGESDAAPDLEVPSLNALAELLDSQLT